MMDEIELGTIALEYAALNAQKKKAVSYLIRSTKYVSSSFTDSANGFYVGWEANPAEAIGLMGILAQVGQKEYGDIWLEELKSRLSQLG